MSPTFTYRIPDLKNTRDKHILCDVFRNEMTTVAATHERRFSGLKLNTCGKVLRRLTKEKYLNEYHLWGNKSYWRLGPRGIQACNCSRKRGHALGPQRLPYLLGCLKVTCLSYTPRTRLLPHKLFQYLPWFPDRLLQWAYLWEDNRLGTIRVEPRIRADKLVQKLCEQVYQYGGMHSEFEKLIDERRFFFVVVTATEDQEHVVEDERKHQGLCVPLETIHYKELVRFT